MRDEMLKKLDALMAQLLREHPVRGLGQESTSQYVPFQERRRWAVLRAELAAERCENCTYWRSADGGSTALCMKSGSYLYQVATVFHYYCSHFEKKEP